MANVFLPNAGKFVLLALLAVMLKHNFVQISLMR